MTEKDDAITKIHELMQQYKVSLNDIAVTTLSPDQEKPTNQIKKIFSYLGSIFIICGIGVLISQQWDAMNSAARIIITLGVGLAFYIFSIIAARDVRFEKMLTPFFILAAALETVGMFVTLNELFPYKTDWHFAAMAVFGTLLVQQFLTFWTYPRTSLVFLTLAFGTAFFLTIADYLQIGNNNLELIIGFIICITAFQLADTRHLAIVSFWYVVGSIIFLWSLFTLVQHTYVEFLYLAASVLIIYMSTMVKSRTLLFVGTISLITYIGYFTSEHFAHSIGWPLSLLLFGFIMLGISLAAFKIAKTIK